MALLGSLSCSSGDTLASELGSVLSRSDPWLITSFRRVPKGKVFVQLLYVRIFSVIHTLY